MIYKLDENILIYNLIDKIPIIKNLLLAESCRFFNNIVSHNNGYMNIKQFCIKLKKSIRISIIEKKSELFKKIKQFNILIGQIKLFYLLIKEFEITYNKIKIMLQENYSQIDFYCFNCKLTFFDLKKFSIVTSKKKTCKIKYNKNYIICNNCIST